MQPKRSSSGYVMGRLRAVRYVWRGMRMMLGREHSFQVQSMLLVLTGLAGWMLHFRQTDWLFFALAWGLILTAETLNTAIERLADRITTDYDEQIRDVKDLAAGGVGWAALAGGAVLVALFVLKLKS